MEIKGSWKIKSSICLRQGVVSFCDLLLEKCDKKHVFLRRLTDLIWLPLQLAIDHIVELFNLNKLITTRTYQDCTKKYVYELFSSIIIFTLQNGIIAIIPSFPLTGLAFSITRGTSSTAVTSPFELINKHCILFLH